MFTDKIAVVTGGSSGLGRAIALRLAHEGARGIVVLDTTERPREGGARTADEIRAATKADGVFVRGDVTSAADVERAVETAARMGGLDLMVNNAGIVGTGPRLADADLTELERVLAVNVKGAFLGCRAAAARMVEQRAGAIVNISSVVALAGSARTAIYAASKGAVTSLSYALAAELGPSGVRVNAVHPGVIETTMTTVDQHIADEVARQRVVRRIPLRTIGTPDDVAGVVAFLGSDSARYVTGTATVVDGGWSRGL